MQSHVQKLLVYTRFQGEFGHLREMILIIVSQVAKFAYKIFYETRAGLKKVANFGSTSTKRAAPGGASRRGLARRARMQLE